MKHCTPALVLAALAASCVPAPIARPPSGGATMSMLSASLRSAQNGKTALNARRTPTATHHYRDGDEARPLWLSPDTLAELDPSDAGRRELLLLDPLAEQTPSGAGGARIWKTRSPLGAEELIRGMSLAGLPCSPVWRTVNDQEGELLAFPGGVLLEFPVGWTDGERREFLLAYSLRALARPLDTDQLLLIDSAPGLEALELANRLAGTSPGVRCWPNTWRSYGSM